MEVSRTSMKVARVTVKAMSQGLWRGRQAGRSKEWSAVMVAVATKHLGLRVQATYYIHACMYLVKRRWLCRRLEVSTATGRGCP